MASSVGVTWGHFTLKHTDWQTKWLNATQPRGIQIKQKWIYISGVRKYPIDHWVCCYNYHTFNWLFSIFITCNIHVNARILEKFHWSHIIIFSIIPFGTLNFFSSYPHRNSGSMVRFAQWCHFCFWNFLKFEFKKLHHNFHATNQPSVFTGCVFTNTSWWRTWSTEMWFWTISHTIDPASIPQYIRNKCCSLSLQEQITFLDCHCPHFNCSWFEQYIL